MPRYLPPLLFLGLILSAGLLSLFSHQARETDELVVVTRNSATTFYEGRDGLSGFEYDLVQMFAREVGREVRFVVPNSFDETLPMVARGKADFAAAGITVTETRKQLVRFTPGYQQITQQVIYRNGTPRPRSLEDTAGGIFEIVAGSSHEEELIRRLDRHPDLEWDAKREMGSEELLYLVRKGLIDYTIGDANEVALNRRYYPELMVAFNLTQPQQLAWAFPRSGDPRLYEAASDFIKKIKKNGELKQLVERYYGYVEHLDYVDTNTFKYHVQTRLPLYTRYFREAAKSADMDWKLLAAIGYQESHWDQDAVSPTGVRGIMMLTEPTALQVGIQDRTDPQQSIQGGGRYFHYVRDRIPERIQEPDRTWFALATYNVGFGHLNDARILTQRSGDNPDKWVDVKRYLPLLSQEKYFKTVKHGYARGREPVQYVDSIRGYYELLSWLFAQDEDSRDQPMPQLPTPAAL
jgi:membrane-bound lytic murein transglycosylase F